MLRFICLVCLLCPSLLASSQAETFTLFVFRDAYQILPDKDGKGGFAQMMTLLEKERESAEHSFTFLNGSFLSPLYFSGWDRGEHIVDLLNQMRVDAVLFEDHCFDYGSSELKKRIQESKFQWLSNNLIHRLGLHSPNSMIIQAGDLKVGILSLSEIHSNVLQENFGLVYCPPPSDVLFREIQSLKKNKVDLLLLLSNLTMEKDREIARKVPEIDAIIGCGREEPLTWYENRTLVMQIGKKHSQLDRIDFVVEKTTEPHHFELSVYPSWRRINNQGVSADETLAKKIDEYHNHCLASHSKEVNYLFYQIQPKERFQALIKAFQKVIPIDGILLASKKIDVGSHLLDQFFVLDVTGQELVQIIQEEKNLYAEFWNPKLRESLSQVQPNHHYKIGILGESDLLKKLSLQKVGLQQIDLAKLIIELQQWTYEHTDDPGPFSPPKL